MLKFFRRWLVEFNLAMAHVDYEEYRRWMSMGER